MKIQNIISSFKMINHVKHCMVSICLILKIKKQSSHTCTYVRARAHTHTHTRFFWAI